MHKMHMSDLIEYKINLVNTISILIRVVNIKFC